MRSGLSVILKRELFALAVSPVTYLTFTLFYLFRAFEVQSLIAQFGQRGSVEGFAYYYLASPSTQFAVVMVPPVLTMRALAEEKRTGSLELLVTAPVRDHQIVLGKWAAAQILYMLLWLPGLLMLVLLQGSAFLGASFAWGPVLSGYLGLLALGSMLVAFGILSSSLTDNQLLASLCSMLFGLGLLVLPPLLVQKLAAVNEAFAHPGVDSGILPVLLDQAHVARHLGAWFFRGVVDSGHLAFYLTSAALFLFFAVRVLESRRWK